MSQIDPNEEYERKRKVPMKLRKQQLLDAITEDGGNLQKVQDLISSGVEVNQYAEFPEAQTPLIAAIFGENEDIVKLLLQNGASLQEHNVNQLFPIHVAALIGCLKIVKLLLGEGDIDGQLKARTKVYATPLMAASSKGHTLICQLLIHHGADIHAGSDKKQTSFMYAAERGHASTMELLLKNGADPRAQDVYGRTSLSMSSSSCGHIDAVKFLLPFLDPEDLMTEDEEGNTAAFWAARVSKFDIMNLILERGDDDQQFWRSSKSSILHYLVNISNGYLTREHCHHFKDLINQKDCNGFTPAQIALRMNRVDSFNTLVQYQTQLLQTDSINLLKLALQYAHPEVVDMIQYEKSISHMTNHDWLFYLTSIAGKSQERMTILNKHATMFSNRRQQRVKESIANAIKNNHLDVLKKLIVNAWTTSPSELASIWPLWTAIDVGNDDIAVYLLQLDSIFQYQAGPDGSSPLQLCLIRDNKKVLTAWNDKYPHVVQTYLKKESFKEDVRTEFKRMLDANEWDGNQYVALCKTYPMFNEQSSLPFKVSQRTKKEFSFWADVFPHSIDVRTCIPTTRYDHKHCAGHVGDKKVLACEILLSMVRYIFDIEDELNKEGVLMELLGPKFILIGSIPEGTRLGNPDELDMSTMFDGIQPTFFDMKPSDAFGLKLSEDGVNFFTKVQENETFKQLKLPSLVMEDQMFNVLAFQQLFLTALEQAISRVKLPKNVKLGTSNSIFDVTNCEQCITASHDEGTWMHCSECFPLLAQTKRGVVLNLNWSNGDVGYKCSIDLVPMYPVSERDLCNLFESVFQTLIEKKPAGWRGYLGKYVDIDRPVHGALVALKKKILKAHDRPLLIAMKVLNYGPGSNYIQCPGQSTGIKHFASRRIREAYLLIKGLIKLLDLQVKSYYLKNMLLSSVVIDLSQTARNNQHFLLSVLCQPEWGALFTDHLDMDKMEYMIKTFFDQEFKAMLK